MGTTNNNATKSKLSGCRAVQFSENGERLESNVCGGHGICEESASISNPEASVYSCNCDNGLCNNVTGKCTCFVDGEVDPKRCKDKADTLCKPETCSFGKCVNSTHCKCDPGFTGKHCDKLICPEDCNWNQLRPQGECVYNAEGDMSNGKCQCYPGWKGDACDKPEESYEAGSACDQDCSNQCLDDFSSRCKISFDYFTTIWDKKSKTTVAKQVPIATSKIRPTLEQ